MRQGLNYTLCTQTSLDVCLFFFFLPNIQFYFSLNVHFNSYLDICGHSDETDISAAASLSPIDTIVFIRVTKVMKCTAPQHENMPLCFHSNTLHCQRCIMHVNDRQKLLRPLRFRNAVCSHASDSLSKMFRVYLSIFLPGNKALSGI